MTGRRGFLRAALVLFAAPAAARALSPLEHALENSEPPPLLGAGMSSGEVVTINMVGDGFTAAQIRALLDAINEHNRETGARVVVL